MSVVAVATTTTTSCERDRSTHQYTRNPYLLGSWKVKRPPSWRVLLSLKVATAPYTQTGTHTHTHFYMNTLYITLHKSPLSICRLLVELTSATFSRYWYVLWVAQSLPLSLALPPSRSAGKPYLYLGLWVLCAWLMRRPRPLSHSTLLCAQSGIPSSLPLYITHSNRLCPIFKALNWIIDFQLVPAFDFLYFCTYIAYVYIL